MSHLGFSRYLVAWARSGARLVLLPFGVGLLFSMVGPAYGQTYTVLYNFCSQPKCTDGYYSAGNLLLDKNGNLYGTTELGGTGPNCNAFFNGCGTVFEL